jgi:FHA domain/Trypsin-like peptidase domain
MASAPTQQGRPNLAKSVGSGIRSLAGGGGRTFFILRHITPSKKYRANQDQEIIVDYIELGRDAKCHIQYDDSQKTVSRRHAAISREGNTWMLKNLSESSPTLINGRPVTKQWFLQNGDEIQLSLEGPRLGFVLPSNNVVSSIPLSRRFSLFREQALRPYKQGLMVLAAALLLVTTGGGYLLWQSSKEIQGLNTELVAAVSMSKKLQNANDSIAKNLDKLKKTVSKIPRNPPIPPQVSVPNPNPTPTPIPTPAQPQNIQDLFPNVYFIRAEKVVIEFEGETKEIEYSWSGTGFLTTDGRFITARHVVEPWFFMKKNDPNPTEVICNIMACNGGKVTAHFTAYSPSGQKFSFKSTHFSANRSSDETSVINSAGLGEAKIRIAGIATGADWATANVGRTGQITFDNSLSRNLTATTELHILGYPLGLGADGPNQISPYYTKATVATSGLSNNLIMVTNRGFESGNSGGPVFAVKDGKYVAVGIVSIAVGNSTGGIIPIGNAQ